MKRSTFVLINLLIVILLIVGVIILGWVFINMNLDTKEAQITTKFSRLEAAAGLYYGRLRFYSGVCSDIGVPSDFSCAETEQAYAIEAQIEPGWYYCIDSSGFNGKMPYSKGPDTVCQQ